jgi:hypothetical protein
MNPLKYDWTVRAGYACWLFNCQKDLETMTPKYPDITVELTGHDGNAFAVLGRCRQAATEADFHDDEIATFMAEAMASDYDHLLQTAMLWFDIR